MIIQICVYMHLLNETFWKDRLKRQPQKKHCLFYLGSITHELD